jgi:hypothetical protein
MIRAKVGIGVATLGMALSVVPALSASASMARSASMQKSDSGLCKAYKADQQAEVKSENGAAMEKAIESGNFAEVKKDLLASFGSASKIQGEMNQYLSGAPSKVRSAAGVVLKFDGTLKGIIANASTITQFESGAQAAEKAPKVVAALSTLEAYSNKVCGTPKTPTT